MHTVRGFSCNLKVHRRDCSKRKADDPDRGDDKLGSIGTLTGIGRNLQNPNSEDKLAA